MIESSGSTLRADSECALQEGLLPTIPKVFDSRWSGLRHEGSPWRGMRKPFRGTITGPQTHTSRILFAYNAKGCLILCEGMWQVPTLQQCHKATIRTTHLNEHPMAFCSLGTRQYGTLFDGNATTQIPSCGDRLLHQMGRSRTTGYHHGEECL